MKIWTDVEEMNVGNTVDELRRAMLFKASHIKAKADPELFFAVANKLAQLADLCDKMNAIVYGARSDESPH